MNINADNIKTDSLGLITEQVELLAYKIAGLTYTSGETVMIAEDFRELFVMTSPQGATIYINGVKKGISPDVFEQIPLGNIIIEAEKDNLYGRLDVNVTEDMDVVEIPLEETYGKLFVKSSVENLNVYIDGVFLDTLKTGFFTGIPVGGHDIVVGGDGYFWWGFVTVIADKVTTIEIEPFEYGTFNYELLPGVEAEITGKLGYSQIVSNSGTLWLIVDDYNVKVYGKNFESEEFSYSFKFKIEYNFKPNLNYNRDYIYSSFKIDIKYYSDLIQTMSSVTDDNIHSLESIRSEIISSRFQFDELLNEVENLLLSYISRKNRQDEILRLENIKQEKLSRISTIKQRRKEIDYKIREYNHISKNKNILGWSTAGVSVLSTGLFGLFTFLSNESYDNYQAATITADAVAYKDEFQTYDTISYIALGAGLLGAGVSAYSFMSKPSVESLSIEYTSLGIEMARLEGEL